MNDSVKKKILAVEMVVLLVVSGSVGYIILSKPHSSAGFPKDEQTRDITEETVLSTGEPASMVRAEIEAGPLVGYAPLTVTFHGNPKNESNITSYHWLFSPTTKPIIPVGQYKSIRFPVLFMFLTMVIFFPLSFVTIFLFAILTHTKYKAASVYESSEQNPSMVFVYSGSYSATLTVTDSEGQTSSDTVWVTALQKEYQDHHLS